MTRFGYTILYVEDVAGAIDFYERAFGLQRRFVGEDGNYGELETGGTALAFLSNKQAAEHLPGGFHRNDPGAQPAGFEVAIVVEDVAAAFERAVQEGATPVAEPAEKPWGQTVSYVRDPAGIVVEICGEVAG